MGRDENGAARERRRRAELSTAQRCAEDYEKAVVMARAKGDPLPDREAHAAVWNASHGPSGGPA